MNDTLVTVLIVLGVLIVVVLLAVIIVIATGDDGPEVAAPETSTTQTSATTEPTTTLATTTQAPTTTTQPTTVDLPASASIYNQPVTDAVTLLTAAGLAVDTDGIGCSNSTEPGMVRRVTVGSQPNVGIIYGKPSDSFDQAAADSLRPGDGVTVWTPSAKPCP